MHKGCSRPRRNLRYTRISKTCLRWFHFSFLSAVFCFTVVCYRNSCSQPRANVICGRAFARAHVSHATISKNAYPYTRSRTCGPACVYTQGGSVFVRTQGRRRRRLRVCFHGYRRRGTRAFNPTSMMMRGGSRGVVEEGAGRRRIKSSKSFYLSTLSSSFALFFLRSLSFFIYSTLITSLHRVAFSRSLCSFDKKSWLHNSLDINFILVNGILPGIPYWTGWGCGQEDGFCGFIYFLNHRSTRYLSRPFTDLYVTCNVSNISRPTRAFHASRIFPTFFRISLS